MAKAAARRSATSLKPKAGLVNSKTVLDADGRKVRMLAIDANSATFGEDLQLLFAKNVAKARRENVKRFGRPDGVGGN